MIVGGLLLVTMIVLLSIQLDTLKKSNAHIRSQDAKQTRLYPLQRKTAEQAVPLLRDARGLVKPLKTQAREVTRATEGLPDLVLQAQRLIAVIFNRDPFSTLESIAADVHAARGIAGDTHALTRRTLEIQERTLAIQERTLAILEESRGIQEQTRVHAESIDRKTGGPLPVANP